jgi:RND family efflux transporter MFP subunit
MSARVCLLPLLIFLIFAAGCANGGELPDAGGPPGGGMPPADVTVVTMAPRAVPRSSEYVASIQSLASTTIQPQVEGILTRILVRSGDRVRAGQLLAQINPDRQQASVASLEASRAARQADVALAKQQLARMQTLLEAGAVSRAELEQAETAHETALAQLEALGSQIRAAQVELGYYRVTAPSAGVVGDIPVRAGDRVTPSTVITTVDQAQGLEVYVNVPLERAAELKPGLPVEIVDGEGRVLARNPVTFIAPRADDATQSVQVKARLDAMPPDVRVLQYVRARIIWSEDPVLTVPVNAVSRLAGQYFVFVVEAGGQGTVARQKPIAVGEVVGDDYVVWSGLEAGDRVIVSNLQKIGDGAPVKVG